MKHLGDITKIKGDKVPIVDIICGGSPCQDLSVAGKRAGLAGERSGLFMEQIRIIKEMRNECKRRMGQFGGANEYIRPRYMVWENVPGAFSSNNGEDFRAVLEETAKVADENAVIPRPPKKWGGAGCIMGNGWSIAWRVHDAQFWGVPQRRKRIALVADFGGQTAPEILFERKSVSGDIEPCGTEREEIAGTVGDGTTETSRTICLNDQGGGVMDVSDNKTGTLRAQQHGHQPCIMQSSDGEIAGTLDASYYKGCGLRQGRERTVVCSVDHSADANLDKTNALLAGNNDNHNVPAVCYGFDSYNQSISEEVTEPLRSAEGGDTKPKILTYGLDRASFNQGKNAQYDFSVEEELAQTLVAKGAGGVMTTQ